MKVRVVGGVMAATLSWGPKRLSCKSYKMVELGSKMVKLGSKMAKLGFNKAKLGSKMA